MARLTRALAAAATLTLAIPLALLSADGLAPAADHLDAPARTDPAVDPNPDIAADIADVYAWHTPEFVNVALTFSGPAPANNPGDYDRDVLYTINISNEGAATDAEFPIEIRFGQNGAVNGVQLKNVPGAASAVIEGPVETDLVSGGVTARAGLFDDPFFFDVEGFRETRATGTLSIRNDRNFFAGKNITGIVIQIPRAALENGTHPIDFWTTTARFGGNI